MPIQLTTNLPVIYADYIRFERVDGEDMVHADVTYLNIHACEDGM